MCGDARALSQPGGAYYVHHIITGTPSFSELPTALIDNYAVSLFDESGSMLLRLRSFK